MGRLFAASYPHLCDPPNLLLPAFIRYQHATVPVWPTEEAPGSARGL